MKITRISGHDGYANKVAIAGITSSLERQGRAVLVCDQDSTTEEILTMCTSPVPHAIVLSDFNPQLVDLEALCSEPRLQNVLCYVEDPVSLAQCPQCFLVFQPHNRLNDELDDVLPLSVSGNVHRLASASAGIIDAHDESEGGHHD